MSLMELKGLKGLQELDTLLTDAKSTERTLKENIFLLPINSLQSGKYQPRANIEADSLKELAFSIKSQGILLPLIVRQFDTDRYEIIAGERRWRAAKIAGLKTVPVIIRDIPDETALAFALIENIQREALNPVDEALAFVQLKDNFLMTHEEIAERVGRSRSAVTNLMRLLHLRDEVKELLRSNKLEMGHARALISLDNENQYIIAHKIIKNRLSVREAEKLVQNVQQTPVVKNPLYINDNKVQDWEGQLSDLLASKVKINVNAEGNGKIVISIQSFDEIKLLIKTIKHGSEE